MKKLQITKKAAKNLILNAQLLDGKTPIDKGKKGIVQIINRLGYIQIDTISVIQRSHHHTLWTRQIDYHEEMLHELQSEDRLIFEYWGHAMSYLQMSDYRYCLPRMRNFQNPTHRWVRLQQDKCSNILEHVLERIKQEGPLSSKDFTSSEDKKGGTWWDWKPAKVALEILYWRGDLMVLERRKFQKIYDLTERVLPGNINTTLPDKDELGQFFVRRALLALGIANKKEILKFMQPGTSRDSDFQAVGKDIIFKSLNDFIDMKEVIPVSFTDNLEKTYYAFPEFLENSVKVAPDTSQVHLLSPFDNLIIQRERTHQLFDFDYALECYVPAAKRKYGYFVFPILWGDNFVGRVDLKADRKRKTLNIVNLVFEPGFKNFDEFLPLFINKLNTLVEFNECSEIIFEKITPEKIKKTLLSMI